MKRLYQSATANVVCRAALLGKVVALSAVNSFAGMANPGWTRDVTDTMHPGLPFEIIVTSSIAGRLSAECGYQYVNKQGSVVLHGTKDSDNEFSPFVSYEVATEARTKWKTIEKFASSKNPATIEIGAANPKVGLHVDMEPFRSSIGRFRWGRLVLENGDSAAFAIDDLLPPGESPDVAGNFKQNVFDPSPLRFGGSFSLITLTAFSKHLVGDFVFIGGTQGSLTEIAGAQTLDGDFWPSVTLQAGNANHDWQTLEKSSNQETLILLKVVHDSPLKELRVVLDTYKSAFGKFKYGKIIFSGGKFAVFRIADLRPISKQRDESRDAK